MTVWDIDPGYLDRRTLVAEHQRLHALVAALARANDGGAAQAQALRWRGHRWALRQRHQKLVGEMQLRGYRHDSPLLSRRVTLRWPVPLAVPPALQFRRLAERQGERQAGRIPLPATAQQLWSQHKYSLLARSPTLYARLGREVAAHRHGFDELALLLIEQLRLAPAAGGIRNAVQHMWGYVNGHPAVPGDVIAGWSTTHLLQEVQRRARTLPVPYLLASTALAELMVWL